MQITIGVTAILLLFYLYLLIRKEPVRRPLFFWIGLGGIALSAIAGALLMMGRGRVLSILSAIFNLVGFLAALAGAVGACYAGELPFGAEGMAGGSAGSSEGEE